MTNSKSLTMGLNISLKVLRAIYEVPGINKSIEADDHLPSLMQRYSAWNIKIAAYASSSDTTPPDTSERSDKGLLGPQSG